jgi:GT2 family glycosyltransferase
MVESNNLASEEDSSSKYPIVSIIILNYNGKKYLDACFDSISKISYPENRYEVIMIDNCSHDDSVDYVIQHYPWVKVVRLKRNYGFTAGNNIGVKLSIGEYIVFLNNDVVVSRDWLIELVENAIQYPNSIVTSKAYFLHDPEIINHDGSKATLVGRGFCLNFGAKDNAFPNSIKKSRYVIQPYGASMLIKKSIFEELGEFDEDYWTSLEDLDLGLRAWLYGYKVIYAPSSIFYHAVGGTAGKGSRMTDTMIFHTTKNSYMNIFKCFDLPHVLLGVFFSLVYYTNTAVRFSVRMKRLHAVTLIIQGHLWILKNFGFIMRKREIIQKKRKLSYNFLFRADFFAYPSEMIKNSLNLRGLNERLRVQNPNVC